MKNILQKIIYTFLLLISVVGNPAFSSTTFTANGSYTVPAGVTKIKIAVKGGGGGGGGIDGPAQGGVGASGQWVSATYSVVPGTIYTILVGKGGEAGGTDTCTGNASLGGASDYAAGGAGGLTGCLGTSGKGGGGGGATAVLEAGTAIVVAGGGGGANGAATPASTGLSGTCSTTLELTAASTGSVGASGVSFR